MIIFLIKIKIRIKERCLFDMNIFRNIMKVFTIIFDQLKNKCIILTTNF